MPSWYRNSTFFNLSIRSNISTLSPHFVIFYNFLSTTYTFFAMSLNTRIIQSTHSVGVSRCLVPCLQPTSARVVVHAISLPPFLSYLAIHSIPPTLGHDYPRFRHRLTSYRRISRVRNVSYSIAIVRPFKILFLIYRAFLIYGGKCCKLYIKLSTLYT